MRSFSWLSSSHWDSCNDMNNKWLDDWMNELTNEFWILIDDRSLKLRPSALARYSSSTSVEAYSEKMVGWSVGHKELWYFPHTDFLETLHDVRPRWVVRSDRAGLSIKNLVHP